MFQRFSDRARLVLILAEEAAKQRRHQLVGSEHILLGLLQEGDGLAARTLDGAGVRLADLAEAVDRSELPGGPASGGPPFAPQGQRIIELAQREAVQLGSETVETEHLLLGLLREGGSRACGILVDLGTDPTALRRRALDLTGAQRSATGRAAVRRTVRTVPDAVPGCGRCGTDLAGSLRYRTLTVLPDVGEGAADPLEVTVVYCRSCGAVLGAPPGGPGRPPPAP